MLGLVISAILVNICSSQDCVAPWCYSGAYMTVCHDEEECGLVNNINDQSSKCSWPTSPENGVAVKPGMFNSQCTSCTSGTYQYCSFVLDSDGSDYDRNVDAQICVGNEKQTCYVECGAEICIKRRDDDTGKDFYKTGRLVSSCPENHPVNNMQCCEQQDWPHCTCLKRPTVDVSDDVYDALGQSNNFVDVWYGSCGDSEYHATDDTVIKLINQKGISEYYYAVAARPYNPYITVGTLKAKSANADYYYDCDNYAALNPDDQYADAEVWICNNLKAELGKMEAPISIKMYTDYTPDGSTYPYIEEEGLMSLTEYAYATVDLSLDGNGKAFTEDDGSGTGSSLSAAEIVLIVIGLLIVMGVIGVIGYCVYKRRQNKGDVSFSHKGGIEDKEEVVVSTPETTNSNEDA